jgi:hypothetical protein
MATLKKGIIGTPKGKIGNVMCYVRNGSGVMQSPPTVTDSYARYFPLMYYKLIPELTLLWEARNTTISNLWAAFNNTSMSDFEFYLHVNRTICLSRRYTSIAGLWAAPPQNNNYPYPTLDISSNDYEFTFTLNPNPLTGVFTFPRRVYINRYISSGIGTGSTLNNWPTGAKSFTTSILPKVTAATVMFSVMITYANTGIKSPRYYLRYPSYYS